MESTIRISAETAGAPKGGLVGALAGGTEPGTSQYIEVDLRDANSGDVTVNLPLIAEAYRRAFRPNREPVVVNQTFIAPDEPPASRRASQGGTDVGHQDRVQRTQAFIAAALADTPGLDGDLLATDITNGLEAGRLIR
jgi:hypothetical protein